MRSILFFTISCLMILISSCENNSAQTGNSFCDDVKSDSVATVISTEKDLYWESPLGISSYSGEVVIDSINGRKIPNGKGELTVTEGEFKGSVYGGEFVNGKIEGNGYYVLPNGDSFNGLFKDNKYYKGRYIIKETGEYFEGSFKEGCPDNGNWYNSKGEKI